jgi:hypothetical protein
LARRTYPEILVQLINGCSNATIRNHGNDLIELKKGIDVLEYFFTSDTLEIDPHLSNITYNRYLNRNKMHKKMIRCINLANQENALLHVVINSWSEIAEAIRSLVTGNYYSVSRSLRWTLESVLFWTYIQTNKEKDAKDYLDDYYSQSITKTRFDYLSEYILDVNRDLFEEHLRMRERHGKPSYGELVKSLDRFEIPGKNKAEIQSDLKDLYHKFSAMSHISIESLDERNMVDKGYPYSMAYSYNLEKFRYAIKNIWHVLDLITGILLLISSRFYGYRKPIDYIKSLKIYQSRTVPQGPPVCSFKN